MTDAVPHRSPARLVVTGAAGQVGRHLMRLAPHARRKDRAPPRLPPAPPVPPPVAAPPAGPGWAAPTCGAGPRPRA
ncbi:hypothetical protein [Nocardia farcinica]|uniref:hypothetical protein n=1 Tax=Nocardia farcinica TaxID=37329 RepID=UPI002455FEC5|nr:hypothetical protein [Nocardia farcinica]